MIRLVVALICFAGTLSLAKEPNPIDMGWSWAMIGAVQLDKPSNPSPTPNPSGTCLNCNGTGRVGDGTVSTVCRDCNGTGKVTQAVVEKKAIVTIYHKASDPTPSKWIASNHSIITEVEVRSQVDPLAKQVYFDVCHKGKCYRFEGGLTREGIESIIGTPQQSVARK